MRLLRSAPTSGEKKLLPPGALSCTPEGEQEADLQKTATPDMLARVKRAMLAMQRLAWEQGVTAQALLELGETELVILMAKAPVRFCSPRARSSRGRKRPSAADQR
jgi:hypothetical protein